ncbi:MAG: hypothetical protein QNK05_12590, partial [Myxococcota bacterium]|nr:hypothetical protein [Myxococcota bacterium]
MIARPLLRALALLLALALASPAAALCGVGDGIGGTGRSEQPGDGIGGTGHEGPGDGIGGTGRDPGDGIGGTGREDPEDGLGGTGVFGVVSQLSPLCVGGVELEVGPQTSIQRDGEAAELAVGQLVWALGLSASGEDETLTVSQIEVLAALRGRLEADEDDAWVVAGSEVRVALDVPLVDGRTGEPIGRDAL